MPAHPPAYLPAAARTGTGAGAVTGNHVVWLGCTQSNGLPPTGRSCTAGCSRRLRGRSGITTEHVHWLLFDAERLLHLQPRLTRLLRFQQPFFTGNTFLETRVRRGRRRRANAVECRGHGSHGHVCVRAPAQRLGQVAAWVSASAWCAGLLLPSARPAHATPRS